MAAKTHGVTALYQRYLQFLENAIDVNKEPIRVFNPMPQKFLDELELIREVSRDLKLKKDEDMKKAAALAEEQALIKKTQELEEKETKEGETVTETTEAKKEE